MKQQRFVVMLPLSLKKKLRTYAADKGIPMRAVMIQALERVVGPAEPEEEHLPGTQRIFEAEG